MKSKGFTLIELLGVIVVLSLLALIIVPSVTKSIQNGQKEADENTKNRISIRVSYNIPLHERLPLY